MQSPSQSMPGESKGVVIPTPRKSRWVMSPQSGGGVGGRQGQKPREVRVSAGKTMRLIMRLGGR